VTTDEAPGTEEPARAPNAVPFVVALIVFLVVVLLGARYLREDADLTAVRPDTVEVLDVAGDDMIEVTVLDRPGCETVERVQVDLDVERIFVEVVLTPDEGCVEAPDHDLTAVALLPEPIDGREVVPGFGRFHLPCDADLRCRPER
jgi:hypothetical protein